MDDELIFVGAEAEQCEHEFGNFEVIYGDINVKHFDSLVEAFKFYFHLNEPAILWDKIKRSELLEYKDYKSRFN